MTVQGEELIVCEIAIECLNPEVFWCVGTSIKPGTVSLPDQLTYITSVAMPNPNEFKQFLTFKYLETKGLQEADVDEPSQAKITRVRMEVKKNMEKMDDLTIDLNLKGKKKRNISTLEG